MLESRGLTGLLMASYRAWSKSRRNPLGGHCLLVNALGPPLASDGSRYEKFVDARGRGGEPVCIDDEIPFGVPEGWEWARLEMLSSIVTDGNHQAPPQTSNGVPFLVISNISAGGLDFSQTRHVSRDYYDNLDVSRKPRRGDLLVTVTGSFGIPVLVDSDKEFCFQRHIALVRPLMDVAFLQRALESPCCFDYFNLQATGTAQRTISLTTLRNTLIPIPPVSEQARITKRVAELMPLVDGYGALEDEREGLDAALPGRLRRSILREAVRGRLAPQDPADEPASVLLARIRAERAARVAAGGIRASRGGESTIFLGSDGGSHRKRDR